MDIDKITNFIQIFLVLHVLICMSMFVYVLSSMQFIIFEDSNDHNSQGTEQFCHHEDPSIAH